MSGRAFQGVFAGALFGCAFYVVALLALLLLFAGFDYLAALPAWAQITFGVVVLGGALFGWRTHD